MHARELLQLPQEFTVYFSKIEQNLRLDTGILQSYRIFAAEYAASIGSENQRNRSNGGGCRCSNESIYIPTFGSLIRVRFSTFQLNTVWVSCEGENPADIENVGPIEYYPRQGFPGYYYPYENSEGYLSPLVAIHFKSPMRKFTSPFAQLLGASYTYIYILHSFLAGGIIINVECKAWAYNIKHDRKERTGSVHFELMID